MFHIAFVVCSVHFLVDVTETTRNIVNDNVLFLFGRILLYRNVGRKISSLVIIIQRGALLNHCCLFHIYLLHSLCLLSVIELHRVRVVHYI